MKILVVCQHYWPEPYYLSDVCEELVRRGHTVHVVTGVPNYPMGYIYGEYKNRKNRKQTHNGVEITRTFTIGRRKNVLFRVLNYYSYSLSSTLYIKKLPGDYDVVFANQTSPIMMTRAATAYSHIWNKKCIMYCMDVWPACLAAGGLRPQSLIYRIFGEVSKKLYNRADRILITSQMFRDYLIKEHNISSDIIEYLPQYALSQFENVSNQREKNTIDFVFAGNIGAAQRLDIVLKAAKELQNELYKGKRIVWHIIGDGSELVNLESLKRELKLDNVMFYGRKPVEDMPKYYSMADAMLVSLTADPFISLTLPGKVQTYMAAEKPILACANGETPNVINAAQCGFCAPAEDVAAFTDCIKRFLGCDDWKQLGLNGRKYYEGHFTRSKFMDELETKLKEAALT